MEEEVKVQGDWVSWMDCQERHGGYMSNLRSSTLHLT